MEEILDIEELNEDAVDENLKDFMKKDEETAKLLNDKIEELAKEEEKLTKKEEELKALEESSREKISTNASADELIEIAGKIKEVEEELSSINENIKKYSTEKEELIETKNNIEKSKKEYIKSLKSASSNYDEQLKKISEAIEVCDNPTLKQVLSEVESRRTTELSELEEKRISELRSVLKEEEPVEESKPVEPEIKEPEVVIPSIEEKEIVVPELEEKETVAPLTEEKVELPKVEDVITPQVEPVINNEELIIPNIESNVVETPVSNYTPKSLDDLLLNNNVNVEPTPVVENTTENIVNLDSVLDVTPTIDLNISQPTNVVSNDMNVSNDNRVRIIFEREVPNNLLREIYSSSKIMPSLNSYLEGSNN